VEERFRFYELDAREREKIVDELREELEKRREILLAVVYGSLLRGEPFRDVDVAVYVNIEVDILDYKFRLERKLSERVGCLVEVKVLNEAPPRLVLKILESGEILVDHLGKAEKLYKKALDENCFTASADATRRTPLSRD